MKNVIEVNKIFNYIRNNRSINTVEVCNGIFMEIDTITKEAKFFTIRSIGRYMSRNVYIGAIYIDTINKKLSFRRTTEYGSSYYANRYDISINSIISGDAFHTICTNVFRENAFQMETALKHIVYYDNDDLGDAIVDICEGIATIIKAFNK